MVLRRVPLTSVSPKTNKSQFPFKKAHVAVHCGTFKIREEAEIVHVHLVQALQHCVSLYVRDEYLDQHRDLRPSGSSKGLVRLYPRLNRDVARRINMIASL